MVRGAFPYSANNDDATMRVLSLVMMTVVLHPQMIGWAVKPPTRNNSQFGIGSDSVFVNLSIVSDSVFVKLNQNKTNTAPPLVLPIKMPMHN